MVFTGNNLVCRSRTPEGETLLSSWLRPDDRGAGCLRGRPRGVGRPIEEDLAWFYPEDLVGQINDGQTRKRILECWGDDVPKGTQTDFWKAVAAKDDEAVLFSWIEWPDKGTRDAAMPKHC